MAIRAILENKWRKRVGVERFKILRTLDFH